MEGHDYEYVAAQYLRNHGYKFVEVTKASGDYGIDVIAHKGTHKYAVQCKYYSHPVGVEAVQEAVAGKAMYDCDRAMVITNSTYTKAAKNLADKNNVLLLSEIQSATGGSKIRDRIGTVLILLSIFFVSVILSAMFENFENQSINQSVSLFLVFAILGSLTTVLYIYANRILNLKSRLLKVILAFSSFLFALWELNGFFSILEYIKEKSYLDVFKVIGLNGGVLCAVILAYYFINKYKISSQTKLNEDLEDIDDLMKELDSILDTTEEYKENGFIGSALNSSETQKIDNITNINEEYLSKEVLYIPNEYDLKKSALNWLESRKSLFADYEEKVKKVEQESNALRAKVNDELLRISESIVSSFSMFNIDIELIETQSSKENIAFMVRPLDGVKINTIKNALLDVSLHLKIEPLQLQVFSEKGMIVLYTKTAYTFPDTIKEIINPFSDEEIKELVLTAIFVITNLQLNNISLLREKLDIDYLKAKEVIDCLEFCGFIKRKESVSFFETVFSAKDLIEKYNN